MFKVLVKLQALFLLLYTTKSSYLCNIRHYSIMTNFNNLILMNIGSDNFWDKIKKLKVAKIDKKSPKMTKSRPKILKVAQK